ASRDLAAQADTVDQYEPVNFLGSSDGEAKSKAAAHGNADKTSALEAKRLQKPSQKLDTFFNSPCGRHRIAFTKTRPVRGKDAVLLCQDSNCASKTQPSSIKAAAMQY